MGGRVAGRRRRNDNTIRVVVVSVAPTAASVALCPRWMFTVGGGWKGAPGEKIKQNVITTVRQGRSINERAFGHGTINSSDGFLDRGDVARTVVV